MAIKSGGDIATITIPKSLDSASAGTYDGVQYKLKDATARSLSLEYINGTQVQSTTSWTGDSAKSAAFNGMLIAYRLPYDSQTVDYREEVVGGETVLVPYSPTLTIYLKGPDGQGAGSVSADVILADSMISDSGILAAGTLITLAYDAPSGSTPVWRSAALGTDSILSSESILPVQNKVITGAINTINSEINEVSEDVSSMQSDIYGPNGDGTQSGILFDVDANKTHIATLETTTADIQTAVAAVPGQINDAITTFYDENIWVWKDNDDNIVKGYKEQITPLQDVQSDDTWDILLNGVSALGVKASDANDDYEGAYVNTLKVIQSVKLGNYLLQINSDGSWEIS